MDDTFCLPEKGLAENGQREFPLKFTLAPFPRCGDVSPRGHLPGLGRVAGHGSKGQGITQVEFEHGWPREVRNDDHWGE
jgi:hypothetical protein